ncbi:hypothetical protein Vadar_002587 [Vaccinium darrowii]|uniref:Uncharacterized protein n=1 Tax=Vaccinium darrowii TaxID=229202 RepID=A0ACB7ZH09_9ERIC|nr:hypothetical protein Vadar_002587 [Vaccinium darrowii]
MSISPSKIPSLCRFNLDAGLCPFLYETLPDVSLASHPISGPLSGGRRRPSFLPPLHFPHPSFPFSPSFSSSAAAAFSPSVAAISFAGIVLSFSMAKNPNNLTDWTLVSKSRISNDRRTSNHPSQSSISVSFSVYVDNLPYEMDEVWLRQIFKGYGDVVDVFIPNKRSSRFNTKFGFVRFRSKAEALDAVQDLHGILIRDFRVQVNLGRFSQTSNSTNFRHKPHVFSACHGKPVAADFQNKTSKSRLLVDDKSPFADIVAGKRPYVTAASIKVQDEGEQWLSMSAIAKLPSQRSIESLREAFIAEGVWNVQLRPMGGIFVLLTFESIDDMNSMLEGEQVGVTSFVKTICECSVDKKGHNICRANPSVVSRAVNESDDNSFTSLDPTCDKDEDDGKIDELDGGANNLNSNLLIENSGHLSSVDALESVVGDSNLPIMGDQAQFSNLKVVDNSNSFVEESNSPLGNILYAERSILVEDCKEATQAEGNIIEDGVANASSDSDDSTSADLVSADPLINYVDYKRRKKKARFIKGQLYKAHQ